ncbi:hypothetical protein [Hymenobacter algoricola]|uniref:Uncharacterized protein n=1 Tax=Hymenobacter algoricola TaxID=486267 RepID=A0ABP7N483_9BACT
MPAYQSYFDNFFATLPMSRHNFKALGTSALTKGRKADLGAAFTSIFTELESALGGFDESLRDANESTSGDTLEFGAARAKWLDFVDDTMKDYVTPRLRKLPIYADFKKYTKTKLAGRDQTRLLDDSKLLLPLYTEHATALGSPTLAAEAQKAYQLLAKAQTTRSETEGGISQARIHLAADWQALARALRRFKAQLELKFDSPLEVYSFFDFGKANKYTTSKKKQDSGLPQPEA